MPVDDTINSGDLGHPEHHAALAREANSVDSRISSARSAAEAAAAADATAKANAAQSAAVSVAATAASGTYAMRGEAFAGLRAALSEAVDSVGIALLGDSTGNAADEWFYLLGQDIAASFPAYTVHHRAWNDTSQKFDRPTVVQTGTTATERAVVMASASAAAVAYPAPNVTTDLDVAVRCKPTAWTGVGTQTIASKFGASGNRAFRFQFNNTGQLIFDWAADGTTLQAAANSGTAVPFANGAAGWVRVQLDVDAGAANHTIKFFTSTDGTTWTQLGATVTRGTGTTSVFASTYNWELGARTSASEPMTSGRIYEAEVRDGIDGPLLAPVWADNWDRGVGTGIPTIEGDPILTLTSGSHAGAGLSYLNETTRVKRLTPDFNQMVAFLSDSHNEQRTQGKTWTDLLAAWLTSVTGRLPHAVPVLLTQNPRRSPADFIDTHGRRRAQTLAWARSKGRDYIDTYAAFLASSVPMATLVNADGIHPSQKGSVTLGQSGSELWAATVLAAMRLT